MRPLLNNVANNLVTIDRLDEARKLNDRKIDEVFADTEYLQTNRSFFGVILDVKAKILGRLFEQCENPEESEQLRNQIFKIHREVVHHSLEDRVIEEPDTWNAANNLLDEYVAQNDSKGGLTLAINIR